MHAPRTWFRRHATVTAGLGCVLALQGSGLGGDKVQIIQVVFIVIFVVLSLSLHEAAHAWTAWKLGDPTAKDLGRVTLNPLPSIDPFLTIILPIGMLLAGLPAFGGAKPVPVSYHRLRHPLRDMMLVAIAGPLSNFLLAVLFVLGWKSAVYLGDYDPGDLLPTVMLYSMAANLVLAAFNMLPIPPLDGSRVMAWLLPSALREPYIALERLGILLVMALLWFVPGVRGLVNAGVDSMRVSIDFLTGGIW